LYTNNSNCILTIIVASTTLCSKTKVPAQEEELASVAILPYQEVVLNKICRLLAEYSVKEILIPMWKSI
jgi:hypothetical protein